MAKRRPSPTEEDIRRIAEAIKNTDTFKRIKDKQTFIDEYIAYMGDDNELTGREDIQDKVFKEYAEQYNEDILHEIAEGLPTRQTGQIKRMLHELSEQRPEPKRKLTIPAKIKYGKAYKVVYTNKETVKVKGKLQVRYRDIHGRFASIKA